MYVFLGEISFKKIYSWLILSPLNDLDLVIFSFFCVCVWFNLPAPISFTHCDRLGE